MAGYFIWAKLELPVNKGFHQSFLFRLPTNI